MLLDTSLAILTKNHHRDRFQQVFLKFSTAHTEHEIRQVICKAVYPNDYMDSWERFEEELHAQKDFFNKLKNSHITND